MTNAAGALNESFAPSDLILIAGQLNLTGATPLSGHRADGFVNMVDAYPPGLRALAHEAAGALTLREGVYVGVTRPAFEMAAEALALRGLGADAVGMSTVLEAIAARRLWLELLGISAITNAIGPAHRPDGGEILGVAARCSKPLAGLICAR